MTLDRRISGRVVGVISAVDPDFGQVSSGDLVSKGYDFAIGSMGFRVAASKDTPYQRETADWKKEQFDSAPVVGEQSLDGWWLRSQFSYHHGAGIRYYEVVEGDTVFNRYHTADGLDPWTPGEVNLVDNFAAPTGANIVDMVPGTHGGNVGVFELLSDGNIQHRTSAGTTVFTEGGTATSITSSGSKMFATVGNLIKVYDGTTTLATLITLTDAGKTWQGVWWAKGRLFAVDSDDNWYAVAPVTASVNAATNSFWKPGATPVTWVLTETPAFVLIGGGTDIYAVTIQNDGSVPALAAPVVVAQVPVGETIGGLHHYLGFVAIATQAGLRIGQADSSNGNPVMVYGPTLIEGNFSACGRMASKGSLIYALGSNVDYSPATLFAVNLEQQVSDLRPAWTAHFELGSAVSSHQGAVIDANGLIWAWSNNQVRRQDSSLVATGTLETGQLRFATLENKLFRTVKVRADGAGGTVGISTVLPDGSVNFILSMNVANDKEKDVTVQLPSPTESLGFQFTMTADPITPANRPRFLGYQVRALPASTRQRIIRVPLLLQDTERLRYGPDSGHDSGAWERLQALEDLESAQVLVQFTDIRTGESGVAQIDKVTFQGETPSKGKDDNFGGIVYVELRKVG